MVTNKRQKQLIEYMFRYNGSLFFASALLFFFKKYKFVYRNLFSRKAKENEEDDTGEQGWKLFGRVPPKQAPDKDPQQITQEFQHKLRAAAPPKPTKKSDIEVMSTTALILENRPQ